MSRPVWARGLKPFTSYDKWFQLTSRPVWARGLKRLIVMLKLQSVRSRPVWARGLKPIIDVTQLYSKQSRPVWARGLKLYNITILVYRSVAPRVGAWIETAINTYADGDRRAPCGRVD